MVRSGAGPRVVALGGGHGLAASLSALRRLTRELTAVVTVADNGGSSGRLRCELGAVPPGDLRMALVALAGANADGQGWASLMQHRFGGHGALAGHALGNLLITGMAERLDSTVEALDFVARTIGAVGRVLPMSSVPLEIEAEVVGIDKESPERIRRIRGQVAVATTPGRVVSVSLLPPSPPACAEAVAAIRAADAVVLGPGSWFTSVLPHVLVPKLLDALVHTSARRVVALNLAPQPGETDGFSPEEHLHVLFDHAPELRVDEVIADENAVVDPDALRSTVRSLGATLVLAPVAADDGSPRHDPVRFAAALARVSGLDWNRAPAGGTTHGEAHEWR